MTLTSNLDPEFVAERPDFTGQRSFIGPFESTKILLPVEIRLSTVEDIVNGTVVLTWFNWAVYMDGQEILRRRFSDKQPKTRKSAISHAKRAIRAYSEREFERYLKRSQQQGI